jgi:ribosomal protein S18 acetylase RimI-like enzyme
MISLRIAGEADVDVLLPRMRAFNGLEGIEIAAVAHVAGLRTLLASPEFGGVWIVERDGLLIGYAVVTYGYDLEFGGRDSFLTEIWIDAAARNRGAGAATLEHLAAELRGRGVQALHLQVRRDSPALRLYERSGFVASPRMVMTRRL